MHSCYWLGGRCCVVIYLLQRNFEIITNNVTKAPSSEGYDGVFHYNDGQKNSWRCDPSFPCYPAIAPCIVRYTFTPLPFLCLSISPVLSEICSELKRISSIVDITTLRRESMGRTLKNIENYQPIIRKRKPRCGNNVEVK